MKLSKIKYGSAVYFGVFSLVMYLLLGILQLIITSQFPEIVELIGQTTFFQAVVLTPIVGGFIVYLFFLFAIWIYNGVASKYPISWEVKK